MKLSDGKKVVILFGSTLLSILLLIGAKSMDKQTNDTDTYSHVVSDISIVSETSGDVWTQEQLDEYFWGLDDEQLILEMPEGGFLYSVDNPTPGVADATITDEYGNTIEYDVDTDPNTETVAQAKARMLGQPIKYE